jgi:hypothetical protein
MSKEQSEPYNFFDFGGLEAYTLDEIRSILSTREFVEAPEEMVKVQIEGYRNPHLMNQGQLVTRDRKLIMLRLDNRHGRYFLEVRVENIDQPTRQEVSRLGPKYAGFFREKEAGRLPFDSQRTVETYTRLAEMHNAYMQTLRYRISQILKKLKPW